MQLYITVFSFIDIEGQSWYYYLDDVLKILLYSKASAQLTWFQLVQFSIYNILFWWSLLLWN